MLTEPSANLFERSVRGLDARMWIQQKVIGRFGSKAKRRSGLNRRRNAGDNTQVLPKRQVCRGALTE